MVVEGRACRHRTAPVASDLRSLRLARLALGELAVACTIGRRRPEPKDLREVRSTSGAWRRLYSLRSMRASTSRTSAASRAGGGAMPSTGRADPRWSARGSRRARRRRAGRRSRAGPGRARRTAASRWCARGMRSALGVRATRQRVDVALVDVAEHGEPAHGVAVERAVADRELALVAGREHQPVLGVRDRHQDRAADARLDVLLRDAVVAPRAEELAKDVQVGVVDRADVDAAAPRCRAGGRARARPRRCAPRRRAPASRRRPRAPARARCTASQAVTAESMPPERPDHRARRQALLAEVVADAEHEARLELRDRVGIAPRPRARAARVGGRQIDHAEGRCRRAAARRARARARPPRRSRRRRSARRCRPPGSRTRSATRWRVASAAIMRRRSAALPTCQGEHERLKTSAAPARASSPTGSLRIAHLVDPGVLADGQPDRRAAEPSDTGSRRAAGTK